MTTDDQSHRRVDSRVLGTLAPPLVAVGLLVLVLVSELLELQISTRWLGVAIVVMVALTFSVGWKMPTRVRATPDGLRLDFIARRTSFVSWAAVTVVTKWQMFSLSLDVDGFERLWLPAPITSRASLIEALREHDIDVTYWSDRRSR